MDFDLTQAFLFAAIPPLAFFATIRGAEFKPDIPSFLGKIITRYIWQIAALASLCTFLAYWAWTSDRQSWAVVAAFAAFPAYVALGTVAVFSRRAFAMGKEKRR